MINDKIQKLNSEIMTCEDEIAYLQELLVTTAGPANEILEDISRCKHLISEKRRMIEVIVESDNIFSAQA